MTVSEAIALGTSVLQEAGVESPRLNVEEMLACVLNLTRPRLVLEASRELSSTQRDRLVAMIQRRRRREPLQHILGTVSFCGLEIAVGAAALIPRPETELLAEHACRCLRKAPSDPPLALDFGTGTGCLAIALAVNAPQSMVDALDISEPALELARRNARIHGVDHRVAFHCGDGFAALRVPKAYDVVVSNPPYIPAGEIQTLAPEVRDHDPRLALDGGPDGLDFYRRLAAQCRSWLKPGGRLLLEFGDGQADALRELLGLQKWIVEAVEADYTRRPRILVARGTL